MTAEVDFSNYGRRLGIALRRKMRRDVLGIINEDSPDMAWRDKILLIDKLTKYGPIYLTCGGITTVYGG